MSSTNNIITLFINYRIEKCNQWFSDDNKGRSTDKSRHCSILHELVASSETCVHSIKEEHSKTLYVPVYGPFFPLVFITYVFLKRMNHRVSLLPVLYHAVF